MDIIKQAFRLLEVVTGFTGRARKLYYAVVLLGHSCPRCGGRLAMVGEGICRCQHCRHGLDPTVAFQRCVRCDAKVALSVRRYRCRHCGSDVTSRFLFDGLVFDADYFRVKMAESRERRRHQRDRVRKMLAKSRSGLLAVPAAELSSVPGLVDALNSLTLGADQAVQWEAESTFDLKHYQSHIQAHIRDFPGSLDDIPPLAEDARKDRIWRFVAVIFLAHFGLADVWQEGEAIMVMKHETYGEGQDVPGDLEAADGFEGSLGGIEA